MHCLLIGPGQLTRYPALLIESADETWRCSLRDDAVLPGATLPEVLLLFPGEAAQYLLDMLFSAPPLPPPWLITCGFDDARCDASIPPEDVGQLPALIRSMDAEGRLPTLSAFWLAPLTDLSTRQLHALHLRPRLGAWRFLPDMLARVTLHPPMLTHLSGVVYPLCGAPCGLNGAAVERSLRIAVESAWSTSPLIALEAFFGQSIDPNKGKPTNREFLCQMAEHLRLAALAEMPIQK